MEIIETDICIIGAGFAGLAAAYKLKQKNKSIPSYSCLIQLRFHCCMHYT